MQLLLCDMAKFSIDPIPGNDRASINQIPSKYWVNIKPTSSKYRASRNAISSKYWASIDTDIKLIISQYQY